VAGLAAVAAAAAFASTAAIPIVGPPAAPGAAAAAYAAVMAMMPAAAAEQGWELPKHGGPFPALLHKKEMVLPAEHSDTIRSLGQAKNSWLAAAMAGPPQAVPAPPPAREEAPQGWWSSFTSQLFGRREEPKAAVQAVQPVAAAQPRESLFSALTDRISERIASSMTERSATTTSAERRATAMAERASSTERTHQATERATAERATERIAPAPAVQPQPREEGVFGRIFSRISERIASSNNASAERYTTERSATTWDVSERIAAGATPPAIAERAAAPSNAAIAEGIRSMGSGRGIFSILFNNLADKIEAGAVPGLAQRRSMELPQSPLPSLLQPRDRSIAVERLGDSFRSLSAGAGGASGATTTARPPIHLNYTAATGETPDSIRRNKKVLYGMIRQGIRLGELGVTG
jgi:hypothetical protein